MHRFINQPYDSQILRRTAVLLFALAWGGLAFCGEIHDAARDGDLERVRTLLKDKPGLIDVKDDNGMTPLLWSAANDHKDVVEFLLVNHAAVDAKENNIIGPAAWASAQGQTSAKFNDKENCGLTALGAAALFGHKDVAMLLLVNHANVNIKDYEGWTPLTLAVAFHHEDVAELLLRNKADVDARNNYGTTPLFMAAASGRKDMVELLLTYKADVNTKTSNGVTALHAAAGNGFRDVVELLLTNNAYVNAKDKTGETPLKYAADNGFTDIVELLRRAPTPILIDARQFVTNHYISLLTCLGGTLILGFIYFRSKPGGRAWHWIRLYLPPVKYLCGGMIMAVVAAGVWQWTEHSLNVAYERPTRKQLPPGENPRIGGWDIIVTVHFSNLSSNVASNIWPAEASSERTDSETQENGAERRAYFPGEYSEFALKKHNHDSTTVGLAICVLLLGILIALVNLPQLPNATNRLKLRLAFHALDVSVVSGLAFAIVGCFLPWGRCSIEKFVERSTELYSIDGATFPVIATALMWGKVVLLCAVTGMIAFLAPAVSQTPSGRKVVKSVWLTGTLALLIVVALQMKFDDTRVSGVMESIGAALKVSTWSCALPVPFLLFIMLKYRLLETPARRSATVMLMSIAGFLVIVLLRFDDTLYDWKKLTTGFPFNFELGHLVVLAGFFATAISGSTLSIALLWFAREKDSVKISQTVHPVKL
jgi:ankyrin repeat protein